MSVLKFEILNQHCVTKHLATSMFYKMIYVILNQPKVASWSTSLIKLVCFGLRALLGPAYHLRLV